MSYRISILDKSPLAAGETAAQALARTLTLAQQAEAWGYHRFWIAEHHNTDQLASPSPELAIAWILGQTRQIRVGSGGVMLPNHSPLVVAEQFGTLAELHPGRIDLGLGRTPGTDGATMRALRTDPRAAESFPQDVRELQGYLADESIVDGIHAYPGRGTQVPLYILGSSLFGAQLAAAYGLPYAFASHFAPDALEQAVQVYRERFTPSEQLDAPYVIAAANVIAADDSAAATDAADQVLRARVRMLAGRVGGSDSRLDDDMVTALLDTAVTALSGKRRDGQVRMASAVANAIDTGQHLAVQAGTGTGKSLAYLVPAIRHAVESGDTVYSRFFAGAPATSVFHDGHAV